MTIGTVSATPAVIYNIRVSIEGLELGLDNATLNPAGGGGALGDYEPYIMGRNFRGLRVFPIGKTGWQGNDYKIGGPFLHNDVYDDFLGAALSNFWSALTGSDGACAAAIHAANNGTARLTTGAGSTHTMAVNGAQLTTAKTMLISDNGTKFEARLGNLSATTSQSICFGLVDVATLSAPFTISGTTVTGNGTNGAAFVQDAAATGAAVGINCCAINAGGSVQTVNIGTSTTVSTTAFDTYRIEIDAAGNANFFIDGVLVATITLAVATTAVLCPSVGMFSEATSASQTLDIDYILTQNVRV